MNMKMSFQAEKTGCVWRGRFEGRLETRFVTQILKSFVSHSKIFGFYAIGNEELPMVSNNGVV